MRLLLLLLCVACAHDKDAQQPPTALDQVQQRACESCRHNLELCRRRSGESHESGTANAACMDEFLQCLTTQQLDSARCAGVN